MVARKQAKRVLRLAPRHARVVRVRVQVHAVRDAQALALGDVVLPPRVILERVVAAVATADDGEVHAVGDGGLPVDPAVVLRDVDALVERAGNDRAEAVEVAVLRKRPGFARARGRRALLLLLGNQLAVLVAPTVLFELAWLRRGDSIAGTRRLARCLTSRLRDHSALARCAVGFVGKRDSGDARQRDDGAQAAREGFSRKHVHAPVLSCCVSCAFVCAEDVVSKRLRLRIRASAIVRESPGNLHRRQKGAGSKKAAGQAPCGLLKHLVGLTGFEPAAP